MSSLLTAAGVSSKLGYYGAQGALRDAGWEQIGQGCYNMVFGHVDHPDRIVRIGQNQDQCAAVYRLFKQSRSPAAPKVFAVKGLRDGSYVAEVEKLDSFDSYRHENKYDLLQSHYWRLRAELKGSAPAKGSSTRRLFESLRALRQEHCRSWDLHDGNFMVRPSDGRVVVTDPFA